METLRLLFRPFELSDADPLHSFFTDPLIRKYLWDDRIISKEQTQEVIDQSILTFQTHKFGFWLLQDKRSGKFVGFCGLRFFGDAGEVEILYGITPEYWGQGYATEAAKAVLDYGFHVVGLQQIYAGADPPNLASFKVIQKLGMKFAKKIYLRDVEILYYAIDSISQQ